MVAALDTLEIVKRLKGAGFNESQAEAVTGVLRDLRSADFADLATKADIARLEANFERLETATKSDIERLETATRSDIERLETATKSEFLRLETKLSGDIARVDAKIDTRVAELKADIIRWVFGIVFAQGALILGVLRFFPAGHP
jgi:hypothetical protein